MDTERDKEVVVVELRHHEFFERLTEEGMIYAGYPLTHQIKVLASQGRLGTDWAAYCDTRYGLAEEGLGSKLPRHVAESLFPRWATKYSWRD